MALLQINIYTLNDNFSAKNSHLNNLLRTRLDHANRRSLR